MGEVRSPRQTKVISELQVDIPVQATVSGSEPGDLSQLKRYLGALRRRWVVVAACLIVGVLLGWVTTPSAKGSTLGIDGEVFFKARHTLLVDNVGTYGVGSSNGGYTGAPNLEQAAFLVSTGDVPVRVGERLRIEPEKVTESVSAQALSNVNSLTITAVSPDANAAVALADAAAEELLVAMKATAEQEYNQVRDEIIGRLDKLKSEQAQLEEQIKTDPSQSDVLQAQRDSVVNQYRLTYEQFQQMANMPLPSAGIHTIEPGSSTPIDKSEYNRIRAANIAGPSGSAGVTTTTTPKNPDSSSGGIGAPTRAGLGGILGFSLGLAIVLLLDKYDTRLRRRVDVEAATLLPVITEIPLFSRSEQHETEVMSYSRPRSRVAEAYRVIGTALRFMDATEPTSGDDAPESSSCQVILVTSPNPGEGKTTTAANLAAVMAEGGKSVLVVNCDFRRPRVRKYLVEADDPTSDPRVIAESGSVRAIATRIPNVRLVTGMGEGDSGLSPVEIVAMQRQIVAFARKHFDVVVLDTAPFLTTNDASEMLPEADAVLLVVRGGKTRREHARRAAELLRRVGANVLGVVFTGSSDSSSAEYYYHYYLADGTDQSRNDGSGQSIGNDSRRGRVDWSAGNEELVGASRRSSSEPSPSGRSLGASRLLRRGDSDG